MLGSKVLSPQYVIWLLPLVPLSVGGVPGLGVSAVFLAACFLTTQVFPIHYDDLLNLRSPGPQLLLARNLLLAFLWGLMLFLPGNVRAARETGSDTRLERGAGALAALPRDGLHAGSAHERRGGAGEGERGPEARRISTRTLRSRHP